MRILTGTNTWTHISIIIGQVDIMIFRVRAGPVLCRDGWEAIISSNQVKGSGGILQTLASSLRTTAQQERQGLTSLRNGP